MDAGGEQDHPLSPRRDLFLKGRGKQKGFPASGTWVEWLRSPLVCLQQIASSYRWNGVAVLAFEFDFRLESAAHPRHVGNADQ